MKLNKENIISQMLSGQRSWNSIKLKNNLLLEVAGSTISPNNLKQDKGKQWMEQ